MSEYPAPIVPAAPSYLDQNLRQRWDYLAPLAVARGALSASSVDAFARYIIAEQEYLRAVQRVLQTLRRGPRCRTVSSESFSLRAVCSACPRTAL